MRTLYFQNRVTAALSFTFILALLFSAAPLRAQPMPAVSVKKEAPAAKSPMALKGAAKVKPKAPQGPADGWYPNLKVGFTTSMVHNHNLPGVDNGLNLSLGLVIDGGLLFLKGQHSWDSTMKIIHTQSKTPTLEPFVKTSDSFDLKTTYDFKFKRPAFLSVFATLQVNTPLFQGDLITRADTVISRLNADGTTSTHFATKNVRFRLTPSFSPLVFKQMAGVSVKPSRDPIASMDIKFSFTGQEVWADGYSVADDATTPQLEIKALRDYQQAGFQLDILLSGKLNNRVTYSFHAELMYPLMTSIDTNLRGFDLLNAEISFKVGIKISSWASLNYVYSAKRMPLIVNQWQVTNNLVLSLTANIL